MKQPCGNAALATARDPETRKAALCGSPGLGIKPMPAARRPLYRAKAQRGRFLMRMLDTRNRDWLNRRISNS